MNSNNAIEVKNLCKDFKLVYDKPQTLKEKLVFWSKSNVDYHHVLKNINLNIKKGETVCLIGTNGSGKSTLLKLMTKILYPNQGNLETSGKLTSLLELGAGFHPDFTGRENIYFNASIFGLTRKEIDERVQEIIEFSELGSFIDNPVRTYSSGMYMRLAFSVAINVDADILLIDEILAVGDQHFQDKCFAKLEELRDSEKTIVIVSHSLDVVKKLCTRAIWIYEGNLEEDGNPSEVIDHYLDRVIQDHKKKTENQKILKPTGIVYIDLPEANAIISKADGVYEMNGWEVSNVIKTIVRIFVNDQEVGLGSRCARSDVTLAYQDLYGGPSFNETAGWEFTLDVTEMEGTLTVKVISETEDGEELAQEKVLIHVK